MIHSVPLLEKQNAEFHGIVNPVKAKAILENAKADKPELPRIVPKEIEAKLQQDLGSVVPFLEHIQMPCA